MFPACYQDKFVYININWNMSQINKEPHTEKANKIKQQHYWFTYTGGGQRVPDMEQYWNCAKMFAEMFKLGWADVTQTQYFRNVRENLIKKPKTC